MRVTNSIPARCRLPALGFAAPAAPGPAAAPRGRWAHACAPCRAPSRQLPPRHVLRPFLPLIFIKIHFPNDKRSHQSPNPSLGFSTVRSRRLLNVLMARTTAAEGNAAPPDAGGTPGGDAGGGRRGTHMRLLGEIFRPSRNQVTWGWGKLAMRGARMTAASPWDTLCCVSLSSKLPMSAKRAGERRQGLARDRHRARRPSRVQPWVRLGAMGMGSPRGCRGAAPGGCSLLPSSAGVARLAQGMGRCWGSSDPPRLLLHARGCAHPRIRPCSTRSSHARAGTPARLSPAEDGVQGSAPTLPGIFPCPDPAPGASRHDLGSTGKAGAPAARVLPGHSRLEARSSRGKPREAGCVEKGGRGFLLTSLNCCN